MNRVDSSGGSAGEARSGRSDEPEATATLPEPTHRSTVLGRHEIHWTEYGSGDRALVLFHGLSGSSRWWARNIPGLTREYRVFVPDLIGFGESKARRSLPSIEKAAADLVGWVRTLEVDEVSLIGHSMGGQIAIHVAATNPEWLHRLVLVDAAGIPRPLTPGNMIRAAAEFSPLWRWGDPRFLPTILRDALKAGPLVLARSIWHILRDDVAPMLPLIDVPTLIIWGERDALVPLADGWKLRDGIPDARIAILRGAAHNPMVDRPADFNRILLRFLDGESVGR